MIELMLGDCLERMKEIPDGSVDAIITDPPYGTMKEADLGRHNTSWDECIDINTMFIECNRVLRTNGALVLFGYEPFTSTLITNQHGNIPFSYRMMWLKDNPAFSMYIGCKKRPMSYYEDINVFFKKYDTLAQHPLREYTKKVFDFIAKTKKDLFKEMGHQGVCHFMRHDTMQFQLCTESTYSQLCEMYGIDKQEWFREFADIKEADDKFKKTVARVFNLPEGKKFKSNVLEYRKDYGGHHPTQKPVALMEDLIKTYTNEDDTVLDFTMGSGSTGVAAVNTNRKFIGIELDEGYFKIAEQRINEALNDTKRTRTA